MAQATPSSWRADVVTVISALSGEVFLELPTSQQMTTADVYGAVDAALCGGFAFSLRLGFLDGGFIELEHLSADSITAPLTLFKHGRKGVFRILTEMSCMPGSENIRWAFKALSDNPDAISSVSARQFHKRCFGNSTQHGYQEQARMMLLHQLVCQTPRHEALPTNSIVEALTQVNRSSAIRFLVDMHNSDFIDLDHRRFAAVAREVDMMLR